MKIEKMRKRDLIRAGFWFSLGIFMGMFLIQCFTYLITLVFTVAALTPNIPAA